MPANTPGETPGSAVGRGLLTHLRVVDIATPLAYTCGRIFATLGADVVRIDREPVEDRPGWDFGNRGKRPMVLDYGGAGRDAFLDLISAADVLVESFAPGALEEMGLGYGDLAAVNPGLIQVSITPFGQTGPYAHYKAGELVAAALGGAISQMGDAGRQPVREPGDANFFHACAAGVAGALLAERVRRDTGKGQVVDIAAQEMAAGRGTVAVIKHQFGEQIPGRNGQSINMGAGFARILWPVADGVVFYMEARPGTPMAADMDRWIEEATGKAPSPSHDHATVERFLASMTCEQAVTEARARKIRLMSVSGPEDVVNDAQLAARGFFVEQDGGKIPAHFILASTGASS